MEVKKKKGNVSAEHKSVIKKAGESGLVNLNVKIDSGKRQEFKAKCAANGDKMGDVVNALIDGYLSKK